MEGGKEGGSKGQAGRTAGKDEAVLVYVRMTMLGAKVLVCLAVLALALPVPQACTHMHIAQSPQCQSKLCSPSPPIQLL